MNTWNRFHKPTITTKIVSGETDLPREVRRPRAAEEEKDLQEEERKLQEKPEEWDLQENLVQRQKREVPRQELREEREVADSARVFALLLERF